MILSPIKLFHSVNFLLTRLPLPRGTDSTSTACRLSPRINDQNFASFENLGKVLSTEGTKEIPTNNETPFLGNTRVLVEDIDIPPDDFIAVELEPYIDLSELQRKVAYPEMARRAGIEGKVIIRVLVGKDGKPLKSIIELSENELLNESAVKAVMSSIFTPAGQNGNPVALWVSIPINFRLR